MQAAPAIPVQAAPAAAPAAAQRDVARVEAAEGLASSPWLYRSEGFAEDLDADSAAPSEDSLLLRWGLPAAALIGVVALAAAFSLV